MLGSRWCWHTANRQGGKICTGFCVMYGRDVVGAKMQEVNLSGQETVLRVARDAGLMVKPLRLATNEYTPPYRYQYSKSNVICSHPDVGSTMLHVP